MQEERMVSPMFLVHFTLPEKPRNREDTPDTLIYGAELYIETENGYFPCLGWRDHLLSVISMWMGNTLKMVELNEGQSIENYFMNGPYYFSIQRMEESSIKIQFYKKKNETDVLEEIPAVNMPFADYCKIFLDFIEKLRAAPGLQSLGTEKERIKFEQNIDILVAFFDKI